MTEFKDTLARIPRDMAWPLPDPHNAKGKPRLTGIEIEFAGLTESDAARLVQREWGGRLDPATAHDITIRDSTLGDVRIELDIVLRDHAGHAIADKLLDWSRAVVPVEIITAPLAHADLDRVETLITALVNAGAAGSQDGVLYGFGLHLNPEITGTDASDILPTLRAYALMEDWLRAIDPPDPSRRLLPFVDPWPQALVDALATDAAAELDALARTYARLSPTRNHGLDLLPLLEHLCPDTLRAAMPEGRLKGGRPTYHYRLPESRLGAPGWSLRYEWNRWVLVERVAADPALLTRLAARWTQHRRQLTSSRQDWAAQVDALLATAAIWA
ncbi:MAG: amidoligase family protein [Paracoccaceae bacterium]|nr:amidoligase family protein [Paracoccaceae bacterium]